MRGSKKRDLVFRVLFLLLILLGGLLRLWHLEIRPMHGDEAVHAYKFGEFLSSGVYRYDPSEYHGPSLYYAARAAALVRGQHSWLEINEADLRLIPALAGIASLLLLGSFRPWLGSAGVLAATALAAMSPAMSFYDRYFIHESLLVFFMLALLRSLLGYFQKPGWRWILALGISLAGLQATKTTWVIGASTLMLAMLLSLWKWAPEKVHARLFRDAFWALLIALAMTVVIFSSFGGNLSGPLDALRAYGQYFHRGLGQTASAAQHVHPWHYYLQLLLWVSPGRVPVWTHAGVVILALWGLGSAIHGWKHSSERATPPPGELSFHLLASILMLWNGLLWTSQAVLPYKTPWQILVPLAALILLAGAGFSRLWDQRARWRPVLAVLLLVLTGHLARQSLWANFKLPADRRNIWVYGHTSPDLLNLVERLEMLARVDSRGRHMLVAVMTPDCWPLPWYLRHLDKVGFWSQVPSPMPPADAVVVVAQDFSKLIHMPADCQREFFAQRPEIHLLVYTPAELWKKFIAGRAAPTRHPTSTPRETKENRQ